MNVIIGVSDAKVSNRKADVLTTYALGSCIGVALFDPVAGVGGLLHFQLPSSTIDPRRAAERPLMYADSGMNVLLSEMAKIGGEKRRMKVALAGGAQMFDDENLFDIGRRNQVAIRKSLWLHGLLIGREQVGGNLPVTMELRVSTGEVTLKTHSRVIAA